jgi:hypothetical protein
MADQNKIKEILRRKVRPGKYVSDAQLTEIAAKIASLRTANLAEIRALANAATKDPTSLILEAIDMGDIENELKKDPPKK